MLHSSSDRRRGGRLRREPRHGCSGRLRRRRHPGDRRDIGHRSGLGRARGAGRHRHRHHRPRPPSRQGACGSAWTTCRSALRSRSSPARPAFPLACLTWARTRSRPPTRPTTVPIDAGSGTATMTIAKAETTTTLGAVPNPAVAGQNATFTATVTVTPPGAGTPTGTVRFAERDRSSSTSRLDPWGSPHPWVMPSRACTRSTPPIRATALHSQHRLGRHAGQQGRDDHRADDLAEPRHSRPAIAFRAIVGIQPPGDVAPGGSLQFTIDGAPVGAAIGLGSGVIGYEGNLNAPPGNRTYLVAVGYSGDEDTEPSSASVAVTVSAPAARPARRRRLRPSRSHTSARWRSTLTTALRLRGFAALTTTIETIAAGPGVLDQKVYAPAAPKRARAAATKSGS